jgi:hypothetical protein
MGVCGPTVSTKHGKLERNEGESAVSQLNHRALSFLSKPVMEFLWMW